MKKLALPLLVAALALTGCAHSYVMRQSNGLEITTATKPKLKDGIYHFKDARGQEHAIAESRIIQVEPAFMAHQERRVYKPTSSGSTTPKKHHWYFLWLA